MWRTKKLFNSKVALRLSWAIMIFEVLYVIVFGPGRYGLIGRPLFWLGLLMSLMMFYYRDINRTNYYRDASITRINVRETIVVTLIALTLIPVWIYVLPNIREVPNPNYDAASGPVLEEVCVYDYAQGERCGEKDMNPEMLPRGENLVLGAIIVTGAAYFLMFTQVPKRMRKRTT